MSALTPAAFDALASAQASPMLLGDGMHHGFGFPGRETVELAGIAIGHENVHARAHGAIDDGLQPFRRHIIVRVKRRDENTGDAGEGFPKLRIDLSHLLALL
jgi:hypothetical protein